MPDDFARLFTDVAEKIRDTESTMKSCRGMATTLSVVAVDSGVARVGHVGDCRVYLLRGVGLKTLTEDHTEVAELVKRGVLSSRDIAKYPRKNVLTSSLSAKGNHVLFFNEQFLDNGDRILLMTDGAYSRVDRTRVVEISRSSADVREFIENLRSEIQGKRPSDNYSALVVQID